MKLTSGIWGIQNVLKPSCASDSPVGLVKIHFAVPHFRGTDLIICIFSKFPEDADVVGLGTTI